MFLARMTHAFRTWRNFHANVRELEQLSDRQLEDIGLSRDSIREVVRTSLLHSLPASEQAAERTSRPQTLAASRA